MRAIVEALERARDRANHSVGDRVAASAMRRALVLVGGTEHHVWRRVHAVETP